MLHDLPDNLATPSVRVDRNIFFVNELLQQASKDYFIPKKFFQVQVSSDHDADILSLGHFITQTEEGFSVDPKQVITLVSTFSRTFEDIQACSKEFACGFMDSSASHARLMPNPLQEKSGGHMVLSIPLIVFMDNVSGNISKHWNKHHIVYMSNAAMPHEMLEKEFCIRFVSSSPHTAPLELMQAVTQSIQKAADDGVIAWDCKYHEEVMLIPHSIFTAGNNPMQADECSHGGLRCNFFCWTCKVGGTNMNKKSDMGYCNIFKSAELRTPEETLVQVKEQIELMKLPGGTTKVQSAVASTGTRDAATSSIINRLLKLGKQLRKCEAGKPAMSEADVHVQLECELEVALGGLSLDDHINLLLGMPSVDIHQDTPTEILHTVLLSVVKYFWGQTVWILDKNHLLNTFQMHLESVNKDSLNSPTLRAEYICHFKGGLIGKHFKSLAQVMPYLIYNLVPHSVLDGWTVIGKLMVLLWHTAIVNTKDYLADLSWTINDFLSVSAKCTPSILIMKAKFHFLLHLPAFIWHFGPAILFSTEYFESFNHVFRLLSIYSNHQAPSHDTCHAFGGFDVVKHIVTGGFWCDPKTRKWVHAGGNIAAYMAAHPKQRRLIGLPTTTEKLIGSVCLLTHQGAEGKIPPVEWCSTQSAALLPPGMHQFPAAQLFYKCDSVTAADHSSTLLGSHVIMRCNQACLDKLSIGKVVEILVPHQGRIATHVVICCLEFLPELHPQLSLLPLEIHAQISMLWISDHHAVHLHAAALMHQKKTSDGADSVSLENMRVNDVSNLPLAFNHGASKATQNKGKGKAAPKKVNPVTGPDPSPSNPASRLQHPQQIYNTPSTAPIVQNNAVFLQHPPLSDTQLILSYAPSRALQPHGYLRMHAGSEPVHLQHQGHIPPFHNFTHTSYPSGNFTQLSAMQPMQPMPPHLPTTGSISGHFVPNFRAYDGP
ncbi:hypothetical protein EDB19DRAFT_1917940 [Suillus lakei]|nr:hypothetical protein EDB19DRAFT_1917940 [Suillus lakei]